MSRFIYLHVPSTIHEHRTRCLRQAHEHIPKLRKHNILSRIVHSRLVSGITNADRDVASILKNNLRLGRQAVITTPLSIGLGKDTRVDAAQHPLELGCVGALSLNLGEVDVEEDILGEVGLSRVDDLLNQLGGQLSVHKAASGHRARVESSVARRSSREGDRRDASIVSCIASSADSTREGHLKPEVGADVGTSNSQLGRSTVPQTRAKGVDTILDGSDRE